MSTVSTTKEKVLQAAEKEPGLKIALKTLFPEAFLDEVDVVFQAGDRLAQKDSNKVYLIAVDREKKLRIVGLDSGYVWDDKQVKVQDQRNISAQEIRMAFGLRKLKNYTLIRNGQTIEL